MPHLTKPSTLRTNENGTPSAKRRQLLKAAASTAPLIATLQSGAALANASTRQCVVNSKNETRGKLNETRDILDADDETADRNFLIENNREDNFVRVCGEQYRLFSSDKGVSTNNGVSTDNGEVKEDTVYHIAGSWFTLDGKPTEKPAGLGDSIGECPEKKITPGKAPCYIVSDKCFLVLFRSTGDAQEHVELSRIYPLDGTMVADDEQGVYGSCLCSMDPGLAATFGQDCGA